MVLTASGCRATALQVRLLRVDNDLAYAAMPASPWLDKVALSLFAYRVQCDRDLIKVSVIPEGACSPDIVTEELGGMWGKDFPPIRTLAASALSCLVLRSHHFAPHTLSICTAYANAMLSTSQFALSFPGTPSNGKLVTQSDTSLLRTNLTTLTTRTCECIVNGFIDVEVYVTNTTFSLAAIVLVDGDENELVVPIANDTTINRNAWTPVQMVIPSRQHISWENVASWCVCGWRPLLLFATLPCSQTSRVVVAPVPPDAGMPRTLATPTRSLTVPTPPSPSH